MTTRSGSRLASALLALTFAAAVPAFARASRSSDDALSLVPADAASVAVVRLNDLRSSPLAGKLFENADHMTVDGDAARFLEEARLNPKDDVDTVVVAGMSPSAGGETSALVMFEGRFEAQRLASAAEGRGAVRVSSPGGDYYLLPDRKERGHKGAVAFVSARLVIAGSEPAVVRALADRAAGTTGFAGGAGLGRQLGRIDRGASAWALVDVARYPALRNRKANIHVEGEANGEAFAVVGVMKSVSFLVFQASARGDALDLSAAGLTADEETRNLLEDSLRGLLAMWRLAAQEKAPETVAALRKFTVKNDSESVSVRGTLPGSLLRAMADKAKLRKQRDDR